MLEKIMKKIGSIGIIVLFFVLMLAPLTNCQIIHTHRELCKITSFNMEPSDLVEIYIVNFDENGMIKRNTKLMSLSKIDELSTKLLAISDIGEKVRLCKEYGLISKNVNIETFKKTVEEKARKQGLTEERLRSMYNGLKLPQQAGIIFNPLSVFLVATGFGLWIPVGTHIRPPFITPALGIDMATLTYFKLGGAGSFGLFGKQGGGGKGFFVTFGFVGTMAYVPILPFGPGIMIGAAVLTLGGFE